MNRRSAVFALSMCLAFAGCEDASKQPSLTVVGGTFIFNYREATATYGLSVKLARSMPQGTVIAGTFENPAGGAPIEIKATVQDQRRGYTLETPALKGIKSGRDYLVVVRLEEAGTAREIYRVEHRVRSGLSDDILPDKPLTIGPGYTPNPENVVKQP